MSEYLTKVRQRVGNDLLLLPSATGLVFDEKHRILLVCRRDNGKWTPPGGIIDPGETPAQCLVREIQEETGVRARPKRVLAVFGGPDGFRRTYSNGHQAEFVDILFECSFEGGDLKCDDEGLEARFFELEDLDTLEMEYPVNLLKILKSDTVFFSNDLS